MLSILFSNSIQIRGWSLLEMGIFKPSLENQANRLGIGNAVIWPGFCSDIPRMLSAMDLYVQPSLE